MPRSRHAGAAALCLVLVAGLSVVHAATPTAAAAQWQVFTAQALATNVGSQSMRTTLGRVLDHTYSTPLAQIQASNVYTAGNARYRRVVHDLVVGTPVKIVALGGVATNGSDASRPGSNDYFALYINYLKRAFPNAHITPVRKSVGVAPSAVVAQCIDNYLPTDADLVLLELTRNDAVGMDNAIVDTMGGHNAKAYELLMRKVLGSPKQPALLLTQSMVDGMGNATTPFYLTPEVPQYATLASYYGTPVVSMRNALWGGASANNNGLVVTRAVQQSDGATPVDAGHRSMADMLVYNTQRTAQDLVLLPFGDYDTNSMQNDIPDKPVYADVQTKPETVLLNSTCSWIKNISSSRQCPNNGNEMCDLDYSSTPAMLRTYDSNVDLSASSGSKINWALIGGIIGGVVGGLALIALLLACCIIKKKRHAERVAATAAARQASKKMDPSMSAGAVPITASSNGPVDAVMRV